MARPAERLQHSRVVRVPRRAAEVVEERRRHTAIEAVQRGHARQTGEDLELGAVRLEGVDGSFSG